MALAKQCDRCNELYKVYCNEESEKKPNTLSFGNVDYDRGGFYKDRMLDLCPKCSEDLVTYFRKYGNDIDGNPYIAKKSARSKTTKISIKKKA